jgi:uncharacterized membrane protein YcfT
MTEVSSRVGEYAAAFDGYFPVATLAVCLGILVALTIARRLVPGPVRVLDPPVQGHLTAPVSAPPAKARLAGLDRLRGLAIVCMVIDHLALIAGLDILRYTVGRIAMPLFFVVAGTLVTRLTWRHAAIVPIGLALPLVVPWVDRPNVLVLYVLGAIVLVVAARLFPSDEHRLPVLLGIVAVCLAIVANGFDRVGVSYPASALVALMAVGALLGRHRLDVPGRQLPAFLELPGRFPLSVYVGHVLALQLLLVTL